MAATAPNILVFITDQHRADHLGCYGNPDVQTPVLDALARRGVRCTNAFVANPVCMPNRATLFTGQYPSAHGVRENGIPLDRHARVLPAVLRDAGYATAAFGKLHLAPYEWTHACGDAAGHNCESMEYWQTHNGVPTPYYGFEHLALVCGHGNYTYGHYKYELEQRCPGLHAQLGTPLHPPTGAPESWQSAMPAAQHYNTWIADQTIAWLRHHENTAPFFAWCSFPDPHHPYCPPKPYCDQYDPARIAFAPARRAGEFDDLPDYMRACHEGRQKCSGLARDLRTVSDAHYREMLAHTYGMISMVDAHIGRVLDTVAQHGVAGNTIVVFLSDHGDMMGDHWLNQKGPFLFNGLVRVPTIFCLPGGATAGSISDAMLSAVDLAPTLLDLAGVPGPDAIQGMSFAPVLRGQQEQTRGAVLIEFDEQYLANRFRQMRTTDWAITANARGDDGLLFDLRHDPDELHNLWHRAEHRPTRDALLARLLTMRIDTETWQPPRHCHA